MIEMTPTRGPVIRTTASSSGSLDRKRRGNSPFNSLFLYAAVAILVLPRFILLDFLGSGLRVEDLLLLVFGAVALLRRVTPLGRVESLFLAWIGFQVVSSILNWALFGEPNIVVGIAYSLRPLEYWLMYSIVVQSRMTRASLARVLVPVVYLNASVAVAQYAGFLPSFSKFDTTRGSAFFSGPFDFAAFMAGCFFVIYSRHRIVALIGLTVSAARVTLVATAVTTQLKGRRPTWTFRQVWGGLLIGLLVLVVAMTGVINAPLRGVTERFDIEGTIGSIGPAIESGLEFGPANSQKDYIYFGYEDRPFKQLDNAQDGSAVARFARWSVLLQTVASRPAAWVLGLGPGWAGLAVDGQFVRSLVEAGVPGLGLFAAFALQVCRSSDRSARDYGIALILTALFIDIFVSFKPMVLFWAILATSRSSGQVDVRTPGKGRNRGPHVE